MKAPYKLLWLYILDECNHAGIWQVDLAVAQLKIGEKLNVERALSFFKSKIFVIDFGEKWFIPDFIDFQYGELNPDNRAHKSVISILAKFHLIDETYKIKELISPLQGAKDKDKDKDKDMDKDKAVPKKKQTDHLFKDSEFINVELFEDQFAGTDYEYCDLKIYHEKVKNWSASKGVKRIDWIATARNFMLGDKEKNKLILKSEYGKRDTENKEAEFGAEIDSLIKNRYGNSNP